MIELKSETLNMNSKDNINPIFSSIINHNTIGTSTLSENILTTFHTNEINLENSTIIGTKLVEADNNDERYLKAIKQKGEIAIIKDENKLIEIIKLKSFGKILALIGTTLNEYYYDISCGIYSCEEIVELRKTSDSNSINQNNNIKKYQDNYNYFPKTENKLEKIKLSNDIIFDSEQKKLKIFNQGKEIEINKKIDNKKENKIFENELTFKKDDKLKQKNEEDNFTKMRSKGIINVEKNKIINKNEKEKLRSEKTKNQNIKEKKINKALTIITRNNEINKKKTEPKIKNDKKFEHKTIIANKEIINYNHQKKKQMTLNINNNINKKYREKNLFTPDRAKNKKINKQRNISTILQSKKQNLINFPTEKSTTNLKKNISKKSISNIKNKVIKRDINIRTFKCNKKRESNTNDKMTIKDFYLQNKNRYDIKTLEQNRYINSSNNRKNKLKDINIEKIKQNPKCIKCDCIQDINKNNGIYICQNCKGLICGMCSKIHYLKNPEHQCHYININIENFNEKNIIKKDLFNNKSELFYVSKTSEHNSFINKKVSKIKSNEIIFSKNCVMCNEYLLLNKEKFIISNCLNCKGNLCDFCSKKHLIKNQNHNLFNIKVLLIKDNNNFINYSISKLNCEICQKQMNDFENIYYCDICNQYLCDECQNEHSNKYQEHSLSYIKRILYKDETNIKNSGNKVCRQCETNLIDSGFAFRKCVQCKIYLCQLCAESHIKKYSNHNILYAIDIKNNNESSIISVKCNNSYKDIFNLKYYSSEKKRNNKINIKYNYNEETKLNTINPSFSKNNKEIQSVPRIIKCINCKSNINDFCRANFILGYLCPCCHNNLNSIYKICHSHLSEFIFDKYNYETNKDKLIICKGCEKNLNKNILVHFCIVCKEKLCNNCVENHINENPEHIIICLRDKMMQKNNIEKI